MVNKFEGESPCCSKELIAAVQPVSYGSRVPVGMFLRSSGRW